MLKLYQATNKVSIVFRIKALNVLTVMLNKKWEKLDIYLDWQPFWDELMKTIMRENRYELVGTDSLMVQHISKLASFLSTARPYYDCTDGGKFDDPRGNVFAKAEAFMQDLRMPNCIEGPLLLLSCLPTKWDHYDAMLPRWFDLWSSINQNHTWDLLWSVILARAVKHSTTFDWTPYVPFLLQKIKELLHLPSAENRRDANYSSFPRTFPSYYSFAFDYYKETHQVALTKLTKILVKILMKDSSSVAAEVSIVSMPNIIEEILEKQNMRIVGYNTSGDKVNQTTKSLVEFLHMLRGFVHASNTGNYVPWIATFFSLILRTCGHLLGEALADRLVDQPDSVWLAGRHSALFLSGFILSLTLDGVYNKNLRVSRHFANCLKHIISLQPQVIHVVCTFFLEALQPKASHQPHQTTVALMSLSICVRLGFFPQPYLLNYIPDILRLSLAFLEASDSSKTVMVLDLLSNIFGWMPVSNSYVLKIPRFTSYLHLLEHKEHDTQAFAGHSSVVQAQYDTITSYICTDWALQMLEKIFLLIDSEEVKVKGAKDSAISASIAYFVAMFFQSLETVDVPFEQSIERMIVQYVLTRAPGHTDKTCGKLIEYYIGIRPNRLNDILAAFLTEDLCSVGMASDKLSFRLRVIGALFRQSQGIALTVRNSELLAAVLVNTKLVCHEEAKVRKHVGKVYKDLLKGGLSAYPVRVNSRFSHNDTLGAPNLALENDIPWFIPTAESTVSGVDHLQRLMSFALSQIHTALDIALQSGASEITNAATQLKKCEEAVGSALALIRRLVRGSAELLTDDFSEHDWRAINIATGRNHYLAFLSEAARSYVKNFRAMLLAELATIHEKLERTASIVVFSSLRNNEFIAKQWMKVFHLIITRRVSFCKDVDKYRKGITMHTTAQRVALCAAVYNRLKENRNISTAAEPYAGSGSRSATLLETLRSDYYWKRHDWNSNSLVGYIWVQHCTRSLLFAQACNRVLFRLESEADPVFTCLNYLLELTRHSYDEIRPHARKIFEKMAKMLGPKLNACIASLLSVFRQPTATYYQTASTLVTLKQSTMMRRIQSDVSLKVTFLESLPFVQTIAGNIEELDKKEKIMLSLADCFVKYSSGWSVTTKDVDILQESLMQSLLDNLNRTTSSSSLSMAVSVGESSTATASSGGGGGGLRMDTFAAYSLLHLLSSAVLSPKNETNVKPLLQFIQKQLTTAHGQPTQVIANTMMYRMVEIIAEHPRPETLPQPEWFLYWQQCWNPCHVEGQWAGTLLGLVRILALFSTVSEEGKALWSRGVDEVLSSTSFLSIVKPRSFCKRRADQNNYSKYFGYGFASMMWTMLSVNIVPVFHNPSGKGPTEVLESIFNSHLVEVASQIGDNEKRVLNDIRAEIFGATLRFWVTHRAQFAAAGSLQSTGALLARYLKEQTDACSTEFLRDWQEALYFAWETVSAADMDFVLQSELVQQIVANFRNSVVSNANSITSTAEITATGLGGDDQGFSKVDKPIMLLNATLLALSVAELLSTSNSTTNSNHMGTTKSIARMVEEILTTPEVNIVLPYRTSRSELSTSISLLVDATAGQCNLTSVFAKIAITAVNTTATSSSNNATAVPAISSPTTAPSISMDIDESAESTPSVASAPLSATVPANGTGNGDSEAVSRQNAVEFATLLISRFWHRLHLRMSMPLILQLLPVVFSGVTESRIDTVKLAADSLIGVLFALRPAHASDASVIYALPLSLLKEYAGSSSTSTALSVSLQSNWRVREVAIRSTIVLLTNSWLVLSQAQRQCIKDILVEGLKDNQSDVQKMAKQGMIAYLAWKTDGELQKIAEVYTRNSETLAARYDL